jgi:transcriptional regulator with XRE-family HTH domain
MQASPGISRHQLGTHLRQLRNSQSLRLEDAAATLGVMPSTLSRIETGQAPTKTLYLRALLDLYGVDDLVRREQLMEMALAGQRNGWWAYYASLLPAGTGTYLGLEATAEHVRGYSAHAVPALLQTSAYAEAFIKATRPELSATEIGSLVEVQLRRQRPDRDDRTLDLILDESVLLRSVGSSQVMADQLAHLLTFTSKSSITVRVKLLATAQPVLSPSFTLVALPGTANSAVACLETIGGHVDVSRLTKHVDAIHAMFEALATSALSTTKSAKLIGNYAARWASSTELRHNADCRSSLQ